MTRRKFLAIGGGTVLAAACAGWPFYRRFGRLPEGEFSSPNWHGGEFHNLPNSYIYTGLNQEKTYSGNMFRFLFDRTGNRYPPEPVPFVKTDLKSLRDGEFVWLGHSSLLFRIAGKTVCIDPVLSPYASPVPFTIPAWPGASPYVSGDFPELDYLCISHDHWDHLDYPTVNSLKYRHLVCGRGVGSHFAYWGIGPKPIELDWFEEWADSGLRIVFTPTMHFSGRGTTRNRTLWGGFIFDAGSGGKICFSGDGGYGDHFRDIGKKYGPFDIFFPDSGQYNKAWHKMHMFPEQSVMAAADVKTSLTCPVHRGKFTLAWHPWDEPARRFQKRAVDVRLPHILPLLGEKRIFSGEDA